MPSWVGKKACYNEIFSAAKKHVEADLKQSCNIQMPLHNSPCHAKPTVRKTAG